MLKTRIATAAVAIPLLACVLWLGEPVFAAVAGLVAGLGAWEWRGLADRAAARQHISTDENRHAGRAGIQVGDRIVRGIGVAACALIPLAALDGQRVLPAALALGAIVILGAAALYSTVPSAVLAAWHGSILPLAVVSLPLALLVLLRSWDAGAVILGRTGLTWVAFVFAAVWATDTAAYAVGRSIGRHRIIPRLSPAKTWEGTAAGLVAGGLVGLFGGSFLGIAPEVGLALGLCIGTAAVVGDLCESALKRAAGAKDASALIPGHGGVLDRIDSLVFAVVVAYTGGLLVGAGR